VFENRALRRVFGLKRGEMIRGWRKLHNEELHNLYFLPRIIRMLKVRMDRECRMHGGEQECLWGFDGKVRRKQTARKI
jgi:hypothetical protein